MRWFTFSPFFPYCVRAHIIMPKPVLCLVETFFSFAHFTTYMPLPLACRERRCPLWCLFPVREYQHLQFITLPTAIPPFYRTHFPSSGGDVVPVHISIVGFPTSLPTCRFAAFYAPTFIPTCFDTFQFNFQFSSIALPFCGRAGTCLCYIHICAFLDSVPPKHTHYLLEGVYFVGVYIRFFRLMRTVVPSYSQFACLPQSTSSGPVVDILDYASLLIYC